MKVAYRSINVSDARLDVIQQAEKIAAEYARQGYDLTLRQLYYQFVARGLVANKDAEYKRLGDVLNDARLAGLFDWEYMVDRTREVAGGDAGDWTPERYLRALASSYSTPWWRDQPQRIEVWVEKEALAGVVERAANTRRVRYFSCRGYTSASSLWAAAQRIEGTLDETNVETLTVLHLGDHDPSGIDMTRDITDRLVEFLRGDGYDSSRLIVKRIALNMDQVRLYNPPPNPAKLTDSRAASYLARYGNESWELDALDPTTLNRLITDEIDKVINLDDWNEAKEHEKAGRTQLVAVSDRWNDITDLIENDEA